MIIMYVYIESNIEKGIGLGQKLKTDRQEDKWDCMFNSEKKAI